MIINNEIKINNGDLSLINVRLVVLLGIDAVLNDTPILKLDGYWVV